MYTQEDIDRLQGEMQDSMIGVLGIQLCPTDDNTVKGTITSSAKDVLNRKLIIPAHLFVSLLLC